MCYEMSVGYSIRGVLQCCAKVILTTMSVSSSQRLQKKLSKVEGMWDLLPHRFHSSGTGLLFFNKHATHVGASARAVQASSTFF
jgi:hypothetical protein